jgi:hypothetical protein
MRARRRRTVCAALAVLSLCLGGGRVGAQVLTHRGSVEGSGLFFPQDSPNDDVHAVGDLVVREEVFAKGWWWLQLAGGLELRANSHDQVANEWTPDWSDRGALRPRLSIRRATATISKRWLTVDVGKQFIRWGKADIVTPTDRFAPRDFLNVVSADFIAVTGLRAAVRAGDAGSLEAVWLPRFTPSRLPIVGQRWTPVSPAAAGVLATDLGAVLPAGSQSGIRWSHAGRVEYAVSFFDGFNHLPTIDARAAPGPSAAFPISVTVQRIYPAIRSYGADAAMPTRWFTLKGEAAYFTSATADNYLLYVIQLERQAGEWAFVGGYAGEVVTERRAPLVFAPDRGLTKSAVGRASLTIDTNRTLALEAAVRQNLDGEYVKAEYSQAYGQHWRTTISGVAIAGASDDFLGQYRRNSHLSLVLRYSF